MALDRVERQTQLNEERAFIESALDHLTDTFYVFSPDGSPTRSRGYPRPGKPR